MQGKILDRLRSVIDPHTGIDIVSMGLVKSIEIDDEYIKVVLKPTSPFCPVGGYLLEAVEELIRSMGYKPNVKLEGYLFGGERNEA
ncbi:MAG: metal-sulfur cluster assembly factor [Alishewanella aestuarii]